MSGRCEHGLQRVWSERDMSTANSENETLVDVINRWKAEGFGGDFQVKRADGSGGGVVLRCRACNDVHEPAQSEILDIARFEGASDPDDESVAFALRCVHCGTRGILVAAYGPNATAEEADAIVALQDGRSRG